MPGMPYHLEKGPLLSVLDAFCNQGSKPRLQGALKALRRGDPLTSIGAFDSPNLFSPSLPWPFDQPPSLVDHFNHHWLGHQALNGHTDGTQTGHWQNYIGPVEAIVRETLIRALELALGVPHLPSDLDPVATRHWSIDFWWKCPQPWFEGWVTWRKTGDGTDLDDGHVTVIFATPSDDGVVLRQPAAEATLAPEAVTHATEGSWLISADLHTQAVQLTATWTRNGVILFPTTWTIDSDTVRTLSPKFGSGGAKNGGWPYEGPK
jgi:hypothetical protein